MKFSLNWLNDFIDLSEFQKTPQLLAEHLSLAGFEVESVVDEAKKFAHMVVGQIVTKEVHPQADRLSLCQVDIGDGQLRQIVCGAQNHKAQDKVAVTLPQAVLPSGLEIKTSKIRGVESQGMLASESELGLKESSEGILILPPGSKIGQALAEFFGHNDVIFEVNVTPNRADCLSHRGLAFELSAILNRPVKALRPFNLVENSLRRAVNRLGNSLVSDKALSSGGVSVRASQACPMYLGQVIDSVQVSEAPVWMKRRLESLGMKSINVVVDVTNYVMLELGQPMHAFDLKLLQGDGVVVDWAVDGEKFESFDGTQVKLSAQDLTIRAVGGPAVALAGVVGSRHSGVSAQTRSLFLESAFFSRDLVRKTSRRLGIETDSSYRFSRGVDPSGPQLAMSRALELLRDLAGAVVSQPMCAVQVYENRPEEVKVNPERASQRLGLNLGAGDVRGLLQRLHCEIREEGDSLWVTPPSFRWDIEQEADLIEEIGRLYGYAHIPEKFPPLTEPPMAHDAEYTLGVKLARTLTGLGYHQAIQYAFGDPKEFQSLVSDREAFEACGLEIPKSWVRIRNPLSEDLALVRPSLLVGLLNTAVLNTRQSQKTGRLFELGRVFGAVGDSFFEPQRLGLIEWGNPNQGLWKWGRSFEAVWSLKASLETVVQSLLIQKWEWVKPKRTPLIFHPEQSICLVVEGKMLGIVGSLHPLLKDRYKVRETIALGEFDWDRLSKNQPRKVKAKVFARVPSVERDLAMVFPEDFSAAEILREATRLGASVVQSVEIFDEFRADSLGPNSRSLALRFRLQKSDATLAENEIKDLMGSVQKGFEEKFGARVREA